MAKKKVKQNKGDDNKRIIEKDGKIVTVTDKKE